MSIPSEVLLLTSGVGALQSAFFGLYLFTMRKGRQLANLLLAFLLLAFSIRITKSVTYVFAEGHDVPLLLQNVGYAANLAILPLLWLYLNSFLRRDFEFRWKRHVVHLVPPALAILLSPILTPYFWMHQYGYTVSLILMGVYGYGLANGVDSRMLVFNLLVIGEMFIMFVIRGGIFPINKLLMATIVFTLFLQYLVTTVPFLRGIFGL